VLLLQPLLTEEQRAAANLGPRRAYSILPACRCLIDARMITQVQQLRECMQWSEGQVWCSRSGNGAMTGVFKSQIELVPRRWCGTSKPKGKTLAWIRSAVARSSFNVVNQLRVLGLHARAYPNQFLVPRLFLNLKRRIEAFAYYDRVVRMRS